MAHVGDVNADDQSPVRSRLRVEGIVEVTGGRGVDGRHPHTREVPPRRPFRFGNLPREPRFLRGNRGEARERGFGEVLHAEDVILRHERRGLGLELTGHPERFP